MYKIGMTLTRRIDQNHYFYEIVRIGLWQNNTVYQFDGESKFYTESDLDANFDVVKWQEQESSDQTIFEFMRGNAYAELFCLRKDNYDRRLIIEEDGTFVVFTENPDYINKVLIETPDEALAVKTLAGK